MEISAKWWSLLSDHIRTIKKSLATQQPLLDDSIETSDPVKPTMELQKPLQPSNSPNRSNSARRPAPELPKTRSSDTLPNSVVPLPPRRTAPNIPLASTQDKPVASRSASFTSQPTNAPPSIAYPDLSNDDASKSNVPVAMQMEMALHAAVEERKSNTISNPWGEDEDNVWG
jgi:hypothetical protein